MVSDADKFWCNGVPNCASKDLQYIMLMQG